MSTSSENNPRKAKITAIDKILSWTNPRKNKKGTKLEQPQNSEWKPNKINLDFNKKFKSLVKNIDSQELNIENIELDLVQEFMFSPNNSPILRRSLSASRIDINKKLVENLYNELDDKESEISASYQNIPTYACMENKKENSLVKMVDNKIAFYEEIKVIKPFGGRAKELSKFLTCCYNAKYNLGMPENARSLEEERDEQRFIKVISSKLDDDTFRKLSMANPKNMGEFKKCLYENFHIIRDTAQVYREITSVMQNGQETVANYIDRIEELRKSYEISCEYNDATLEEKSLMLRQLDKQMCASCIDGLISDIRVYCKSKTFKSFKELKEFCIREERAELAKQNALEQKIKNLNIGNGVHRNPPMQVEGKQSYNFYKNRGDNLNRYECNGKRMYPNAFNRNTFHNYGHPKQDGFTQNSSRYDVSPRYDANYNNSNNFISSNQQNFRKSGNNGENFQSKSWENRGNQNVNVRMYRETDDFPNAKNY